MANYQIVGFGGHVVRDVVTFKDGTVAKFTLAVNNGYGKYKETAFIDCVAFSKRFNEKIWPAITGLKKGVNVGVEGKFSTNTYTNKKGEEVSGLVLNVSQFEFHSPKEKGEEAAPAGEQAETSSPAPVAAGNNPGTSSAVDDDEDIPF